MSIEVFTGTCERRSSPGALTKRGETHMTCTQCLGEAKESAGTTAFSISLSHVL